MGFLMFKVTGKCSAWIFHPNRLHFQQGFVWIHDIVNQWEVLTILAQGNGPAYRALHGGVWWEGREGWASWAQEIVALGSTKLKMSSVVKRMFVMKGLRSHSWIFTEISDQPLVWFIAYFCLCSDQAVECLMDWTAPSMQSTPKLDKSGLGWPWPATPTKLTFFVLANLCYSDQ